MDTTKGQTLAFLNQIDETIPWGTYNFDFVMNPPFGIIFNNSKKPTIRVPKNSVDYDDFVLSVSNLVHKLCLVPTGDIWKLILAKCKVENTAFDIETKHNKIYSNDNQIIGFSVAFSDGTAFYAPINYWCTPEESEFNERMMITILFTAKSLVFQGGFFDISFIHHHYGIDISRINYEHDCTAGAHVGLGAGLRNYDLGSLASYFLEAPSWKDGPKEWLVKNVRKIKDRTYDKIPPHIMFPYARKDSYYTIKIHEAEMKIIEENNLQKIYRLVMDRIMQLCLEMSINGLYTDRFTIDFLEEKFNEKADESKKVLMDLIDDRVKLPDENADKVSSYLNLNSAKQMAIVLYQILGLPILGRTEKSNAPQTGTKELSVLSSFDPPLFASFFTYKKWKKYIGYLKNYVANSGQLATEFDSDDFFVTHSYFSAWGTDTGRTSSSKINAQNIAVGSGLKSAFTCPDRAMIISRLYQDLVKAGMPSGLAGLNLSNKENLVKMEKESDAEFDLEDETEGKKGD